MGEFKIVKALSESKSENSKLWLAEAEFGFSHLKEPICLLNTDSDVLEVGCGSGILLSMLAEEYPQHNFVGLEPFGDGFLNLRELNATAKGLGANLSIEGYEQHQFKYDFIYCVNVFEHVDDWQHFLHWASNSLKKNGKFLVLCPNYGFPYESHFKIPIIFNKEFTFKIFKNYIFNYEQNNKCDGLWRSLNFVKKKEVMTVCRENVLELGLTVIDDISIIDKMIERLSKDAEFRKRQSAVGRVASLLAATGALHLVKKFPDFLPYMKLSFSKTSGYG